MENLITDCGILSRERSETPKRPLILRVSNRGPVGNSDTRLPDSATLARGSGSSALHDGQDCFDEFDSYDVEPARGRKGVGPLATMTLTDWHP